ncbi:DNA mismatch repair protein MSH6 [Sesamum angolense]|uniref:DNA mismatch repair protein MSH6 n=1 Tax=Sesamum angolense TaxID=2727404 RepID=A0AAE1WLI3_9LAMI|nr:DNA mismatch repair protein MSH6 [Sesamum angolense]
MAASSSQERTGLRVSDLDPSVVDWLKRALVEGGNGLLKHCGSTEELLGKLDEFFQLANSAFEKLACMSGRVYSKAVSILQTISYSQSCVVMLDLELASHSSVIFSNMENIMTVVIQSSGDSDEYPLELVKILLARLKKENQNVSPVAMQLAEKTFRNCSDDIKAYLPEAVRCLGNPVEDYAEVVASLFQEATQRENMCTTGIQKPSGERQGLLNVVTPAKDSRGKTVMNEDLKEDILIKASKVKDASRCLGEELVGRKVEVWWPLDKVFYEGKVTSFDHLNKMHRVDYTDGQHEILDLTKECWRLLRDDNLSGHEEKIVAAPSASTETLLVNLTGSIPPKSNLICTDVQVAAESLPDRTDVY